MQNRISLVARQSQFVSRGSGGGGSGGGGLGGGAPKNTPTRGKPSTPPSSADVANIPISGSNTSLNSCEYFGINLKGDELTKFKKFILFKTQNINYLIS